MRISPNHQIAFFSLKSGVFPAGSSLQQTHHLQGLQENLHQQPFPGAEALRALWQLHLCHHHPRGLRAHQPQPRGNGLRGPGKRGCWQWLAHLCGVWRGERPSWGWWWRWQAGNPPEFVGQRNSDVAVPGALRGSLTENCAFSQSVTLCWFLLFCFLIKSWGEFGIFDTF